MLDQLQLWAISADLFRQCFAPPAALANQLWAITDSHFPPEIPQRSRGLRGVFPPLTRPTQADAVIRPGIPNRRDAEAMMTSRYIAADRLRACWHLARIWLDALAVAHTTIPLSRDQAEEIAFDLVRAEVPTQLGVRQLWRRSIEIPLRPTDEMSCGYIPNATVRRLDEAWRAALPELREQTTPFATRLLEFTGAYETYPPAPPPDLIAWWTAAD
ncbi:MAG: hypothetical protein LBE83_09650 [Propionibacteriaceae bacterium]|jgi:hypothetical protein|nr:hypothetical protein [Propionibacteriaceae bacterium]